MTGRVSRRKGGVPPIVTVLVTISAIVGASLVAWFLFASTRSATLTPVLDVSAAYITGSRQIRLLIRNVGPELAALNITSVTCTGGFTYSGRLSVGSPSSGSSTVVTVDLSGTGSIADGASCVAIFEASVGGNVVRFDEAFKVARP